MTWWEVIDTTGWPNETWEQRGRRDKWWVSDPSGQLWLRKSPRVSRPTEPAIEAFTLELARRCGFDVAHGRATTWSSEVGIVRGLISRKFHDATEEQRTGAELVVGFDRDSQMARIGATLDRVYSILTILQTGVDDAVLEPFVRTVMFDAWIGNGDRHLGNWALLVRANKRATDGRPRERFTPMRFAPMFDTAGCLGSELQDDHPLLALGANDRQFEKYAHACKSGYGDGISVPGILQDEVLTIARGWPEWERVYADLYPRFVDALGSEVDALLDEVSDDWWSEPRRRFARRMLGVRVKIVEGAAP